MLKIRLTRRGKKNKAFYRIVVAEHTAPIKGRFLEALGYFNPHSKEKSIKADRVKYWLEKGAQCSDTAHNLLVREGIIKGPKRAIKLKKKEEKAEEVTEEKKEKAGEEKPAEKETKVAEGKEKPIGGEAKPKEKGETKEKEKKKPEKDKKESAEAEKKEEKKEEEKKDTA